MEVIYERCRGMDVHKKMIAMESAGSYWKPVYNVTVCATRFNLLLLSSLKSSASTMGAGNAQIRSYLLMRSVFLIKRVKW